MTTKAKKLRREGFVTGNLFGREITESIPLQMDKRAVDQLLKDEGKGGQVMLEVNGQTYDALIKEGVSKDQLELVGFGGTANMFGKNFLNRVVILE